MEVAIKGTIEPAIGLRGKTVAASVKRENVMLLFGCRPSLGVLSETTMIKDLIQCIYNRLDRQTLSVEFPSVLDQLLG